MNWKLAAAVGWTLLIIALLSAPSPSLPESSAVGIDKLAHFTLFGIFAWLWLLVTNHRPEVGVRGVLVAGLLLAILTETAQGLLPFNRQASISDAAANLAGLLAGIAIYRARKGRRS